MHRINFIHQPRRDISPARGLRAILASCAFHTVALGVLLGLTFYYRSQLPPLKSGSAPGAPSITLKTMVIVSPPPEPVPIPTPPPISPATISVPTPHEPLALPKPPDEGVPVLATKPSQPTPPKIRETHPAISPPAQSKPAAVASSYAPGLNILTHPPYPTEARDRGQMGTVIMNVQFDANGNVTRAEVAHSSGVSLLDTATRTFIRAHWHSVEFAGQTISQPVQYSLENP